MTSTRPPHVCFVVENLLPAGTELWIRRLIDQLDRSRIRPLLCLTDGRGPQSRSLEPADCPVLRLGLPHLRTTRTLAAARRLSMFLRSELVDIVQVHHADPTYLGVPVARCSGVPRIVQTKYDTGYWLHGTDLWLHRKMRRWIDATVANCEACREAAVAQEFAPRQEVAVIENGISLERLSLIPDLELADFPQEESGRSVAIGMVANLRPVKDQANLLRAAHHLAREGLRVQLHFAGDGESRDALRQLTRELGLEASVTWHGHVADTAAFLARTPLVVLCSLSEGLPHALLEAMAAGRAVVATEVGGNAELIRSGREGLLVPIADSAALAQALARLVRDPSEALAFGRAARARVAERYSETRMVERFTRFYEELEGGARHGAVRRGGWIREAPWWRWKRPGTEVLTANELCDTIHASDRRTV
jgi:glycosyltransferase involved in cell wall biosynthesis